MSVQERLRIVLEEAAAEIPGVLNIAVFHKSGVLVAHKGGDSEMLVRISAFLTRAGEIASYLKSSVRGIDLVLDDFYVVVRAGDRLAVAIIAQPAADLEMLDYLAFRLAEEVEDLFSP
ncbi:hypothetical protein Pogu_1929 [Pyrobaculum oguniense TE7]|uniref:Roadblock/LAMTOR2 domain-containing protein n=1 Tax=Pyrobaculum oguniense (strain DSM 13380 / JCM 10595 / TE7) TaxID=698757 RepID=H6QCI8_PYROT|nr:hypothetical protein Pogu_1929 [Pyrobaculum oguniense TE7]